MHPALPGLCPGPSLAFQQRPGPCASLCRHGLLRLPFLPAQPAPGCSEAGPGRGLCTWSLPPQSQLRGLAPKADPDSPGHGTGMATAAMRPAFTGAPHANSPNRYFLNFTDKGTKASRGQAPWSNRTSRKQQRWAPTPGSLTPSPVLNPLQHSGRSRSLLSSCPSRQAGPPHWAEPFPCCPSSLCPSELISQGPDVSPSATAFPLLPVQEALPRPTAPAQGSLGLCRVPVGTPRAGDAQSLAWTSSRRG